MSDIKPNFNQNKFANGAGTIFVMAIGIIILPIYGNIIGPEFITILGIYLAISAASLSVDLGLIQRFVRKVSENSQKNIDVDDCRMLWKVLKVLLIRVTILSIPIIIIIYGLFIQTNEYINRIITPLVFVTFLVLSALIRILSSLLWSFLLAKNQHVKMNILKVTFNLFIYFPPLIIYHIYENIHLIFLSQFLIQFFFLLLLYYPYLTNVFQSNKYNDVNNYNLVDFEDQFQRSLFLLNIISIFIIYGERFYLSFILDDYLMSLHIFYMTFNLAIMGFVSGIANTYYPSIIDAFEKNDFQSSHSLLEKMIKNCILSALFCVIFLLILRELELDFMSGFSLRHEAFPIYIYSSILNASIIIVYYYQLCIRDLSYALVYNSLAGLLSMPLYIGLTSTFQLMGSALSLLAIQFILMLGAFSVILFRCKNYGIVKLMMRWCCAVFVILGIFQSIF